MFLTSTGLTPFQLFAVLAAIMAIAKIVMMDHKQKDDEKKLSERSIALQEKELELRERELILREAEADRRRNLRVAK